jgi:GTPase SAR1 family protein
MNINHKDIKTPQPLKVTILGKGVVGKSSLTYRFINHTTPDCHDSTIEDRYKTVIEIEGTPFEIGILLINS